MNKMARPPVPGIGITARYPEIGTGPVDTAIYHEPAIYEKEMKAILRRSWYMIGRIEQVARAGDFFTYFMPTFQQEVLVCRDRNGEINAFHNVCSHRGNVVEHRREGHSNGLFMCRFHGWSFDLEGNLARIRDEEGFFGLDKTCLGLKPIPMGIWEGFIWVCPEDEPYQSLEDFLGDQGRDTAGYAWGACTKSYQTEAEVACNWKLINDSPAEVYHIPVLHPHSAAPTMMASGNVMGRLLDVRIAGNHRTNSHYSVMGEPKPVQKLAYFHAAAAQNVARDDLDYEMPVGINATRSPHWTVDLIMFFPSIAFTLSAGMYTAHQVWPMGPNRSIYQQRIFVRPARTAAERFGQENTMVEFRDIVMEDFSTLERIQRALDTGQIRQFHYHDHELALRHQHHVVTRILAEYDRELEGA
ncbi:aromatic ring-hydroxylating dioxygenase subunit alpha [Novosphingobium sp. AP12]|uniref:aromatic ring-hydroxylating oxygenase subunit alpha n=1 Tax=Novosphingobium sp. AP12 TaxID=1144305 RepID=UPI000271E2DE|nr:SRPBCC family protein [Novosphingobium sp. AP12]EJL23167.1 ring-hydroxylating dioxygenase, large terminal subunit [Novosphingobium sp. AP12]